MDALNQLRSAPFTAAMADDAGMSRRQLRRLLARNDLRQILYGVYVAAAVPDDLTLRANAAALVLPDHAVVCDASAAWLHGIDLLHVAELVLVPRLDAISVDGHVGSRRDGVFGGKRTLRADEVMTIGGIRVTTPLRTACDVARLRGRLRGIAALDEFRRRFTITEADLRAMLPRFAGQRGVVQLRELVALSTDQADSQPESWVRLLIHDAGLPVPQPQVWAWLPERGAARMENAYEPLRIAVEYDGAEFHSSDEDREHDDERRSALRDAGWTVIVVRREQLGPDKREVWLRQLAAAIRDRQPRALSKRVYARDPAAPSYRRRRTTQPRR